MGNISLIRIVFSKRFYSYLFALLCFNSIHGMEAPASSESPMIPVPQQEILRIALKERINFLPDSSSVEFAEKFKIPEFQQTLRDISSQMNVIYPGTTIADFIRNKKLGNIFYAIAREQNHTATMSWLIQTGCVSFKIKIYNKSTSSIEVTNFGRISAGAYSDERATEDLLMKSESFPLHIGGYGAWRGMRVSEVSISLETIAREIAKLRFPPKGWFFLITVDLEGRIFLTPQITYSSKRIKEVEELIFTRDPLDLFGVLKSKYLTGSTAATKGGSLSLQTILSWNDATRANDPLLQEKVFTKYLQGRFSRMDIYRYILGLGDQYTPDDIKAKYIDGIIRVRQAKVAEWGEYLEYLNKQSPTGFLPGILAPVKKSQQQEIQSEAIQLLNKACSNLLIDKGVSQQEINAFLAPEGLAEYLEKKRLKSKREIQEILGLRRSKD